MEKWFKTWIRKIHCKFLKFDNSYFKFVNNDNYDGQWINGKRNGFGTYNWANGETYEGEWV